MEESVVVLYGGESEEREVSLNSGEAIANALEKAGVHAEKFDWHPTRMAEFLSKKYTKVFIALHGGSGENGTVQAMLDLAGIPYTGVGMRAAAICMDKYLSKVLVSNAHVDVPKCVTMEAREALKVLDVPQYSWRELSENIGLPMIVKPARNGSSVGVSLVEKEAEIPDAVRAACLSNDEIVMFERYIKGHELTVAILNGKALGVCEIIPKNKFYDYDAKYNRNDTVYQTPTMLGSEFEARLCRQAEKAAKALDCTTGVVRIDFMADTQLNPFFLEVNAVPGMTSHSLVPKIAKQAGIEFPTLCKMILEIARA